MRLWAARGVALAAVSVACYLTLTPDPSAGDGVPDWAGHLMLFGSVGASFALLGRASHWPASALPLLAIATVLLGAATEVGQHFTGRDPELLDFASDVIGGLAGLLGITALLGRYNARQG